MARLELFGIQIFRVMMNPLDKKKAIICVECVIKVVINNVLLIAPTKKNDYAFLLWIDFLNKEILKIVNEKYKECFASVKASQ